ncbi:MAG: thiamine phosphate synthase [Duncaniella sp.]|nr:thiamine phosphate synthase [Duncaniella sp.]MDE6169927.1 thiamine phosphate synthase [Duncaniella sp.]MDE6328618.1 thiamine phosphate synthase [Duncaniella sp.]MDE6465985.1 thiamine phosphate synthase [Duncaniella sp.]MDE6572018.1 thiamine phosphate synthase [Duncaniella sp.]
MLMFITHPSSRYSIAEEVQMVLEGGCKWIQLRLKDATDEEFRATALEIIPMCQENEAFLVFDDRVELAMEMSVHGVHLGKNDMNPLQARETMGAEAIIGVTANTAEDILRFNGWDVDYVGLGPYRFTTTKEKLSPVLGIDGYQKIVSKVREADMLLPIVAIGGITIDDIPALMKTGINGVAMSGAIINADDPVEYTRKVIESLNENKPK